MSTKRPKVSLDDEVSFKHPDGKRRGVVAAIGKDGCKIKCERGQLHRVRWDSLSVAKQTDEDDDSFENDLSKMSASTDRQQKRKADEARRRNQIERDRKGREDLEKSFHDAQEVLAKSVTLRPMLVLPRQTLDTLGGDYDSEPPTVQHRQVSIMSKVTGWLRGR